MTYKSLSAGGSALFPYTTGALRHLPRAPAYLALCWLAGCAEVDIPDGPDMTQVVQDLQAPSADLDTDRIAAVLTEATENAAFVEQLDNLDQVRSWLQAGVLGRPVSLGAAPQEGANANLLAEALKGEAVGRVATVCRGWDGATEPDAATNGTARLNFTATESGLRRVVWGDFAGCRLRMREAVDLDGTIEIYLQTAQGFYIGDQFVVRFVGRITLEDGRTFDGQLEFRIGTERVVVRVQQPDGHLLYAVSPATQRQEIEGVNDLWVCDPEARQCVSQQSQDVIAW